MPKMHPQIIKPILMFDRSDEISDPYRIQNIISPTCKRSGKGNVFCSKMNFLPIQKYILSAS